MSDEVYQYHIGQWVVHSQYGVGQIKEIENIPLNGNIKSKEKCFQVQTKNGVFWFPVEQDDNPRVRPIVSKEMLRKALKILREPPEDTEAHHNIIKGRITNAHSDGSLKNTLRLVRDLSARNAIKKLNILEDRALTLYTNRIIREWSLCMGLGETEVFTQFNNLLQKKDL